MRLGRSISCLLLAGALALAASAQSPSSPGQDVCTDLSGKIALPCPGQSRAPAAQDSQPGQQAEPAAKKAARQEQAKKPPAKHKQKQKEPRGRQANQGSSPGGEQGATSLNGVPIHDSELPSGAVVAGPPLAPSNTAAPTSLNRAPIDVNDSRAAVPDLSTEPVAAYPSSGAGSAISLRRLPQNLIEDQKNIWLSPLRLHLQDVQWLAPLLGATAITIAADRSIQRELPTNPRFIKRSNDFSNYGAAAFAAATGGAYVWSRLSGNEHMRQTALLSGEAAANTLALTYAIKTITHRDRPSEGDRTGRFWSSGDSFPSEHAAAAWSMATVMASEYPGPLPKLLAYGGAAAITAARVTANKHFASDALVGSALGWFVGHEVYRSHHERSDTAAYGRFERAPRESPADPANMGSPYVPLDSWVYPAMDRLTALGYVQSGFLGLRPWTRMECARLVGEAADNLRDDSSREARATYDALAAEFAPEQRRRGGARNLGASLDALYTRITGIAGPPLRDGYHFGQTIVNDYGRPYGEGLNTVTGVVASAEAGPLAIFVQGELQHAPGAGPLPLAARQVLTFSEYFPRTPAPALPTPDITRLRLLNAYVTFAVRGWQLSFGKQSLWWGPGVIGPMLFSNNAEPPLMLRLDRQKPFELPWLLSRLGPIRTEMFLAHLEGHRFAVTTDGLVGSFTSTLSRQPYLLGQKISFRPTPNFEFGVGYTDVIGGPGFPLNLAAFGRAFSTVRGGKEHFSRTEPGDRRSSFDFSYRVPGLRKWLTLYNDSFVEDEISPLGYPRRAAMNPGIYIPQIPKLPKLDFRLESAYTDVPNMVPRAFFYWNIRYLDGYTNAGNIIGSWVGRMGRALQAQSTYHFSPENTVQVAYRRFQVNPLFVTGKQEDISIGAHWKLRPDLEVIPFVQYERWNYPVLAGQRQSNFTTSLEVVFRPARLRR